MVQNVSLSLPIMEVDVEPVTIIPLTSFAVSAREVESSDFDGQTFSITLNNDGRIDRDALSFETQPIPTASIKLPANLVNEANISLPNTTNFRISHSVFLNDALFVQDEFDNVSVIISADLPYNATAKDLQSKVEIRFKTFASVSISYKWL